MIETPPRDPKYFFNSPLGKLGLVAALMMGRVISSLLYGVRPYDFVTLIGGSLTFLVVAALASAIPSARAAGIPPAVALRSD